MIIIIYNNGGLLTFVTIVNDVVGDDYDDDDDDDVHDHDHEQSDLTRPSVDASVSSRTRIKVLASESEVSRRTPAEDGSIGLSIADTIVVAFLAVSVARNLVLALATLELNVTMADEPIPIAFFSSISSSFVSFFSTDASAAMQTRIQTTRINGLAVGSVVTVCALADVSRVHLTKRDAGASVPTRSSDARVTTLANTTEDRWRTDATEVHGRNVDAATASLARTACACVGTVAQWSVESSIGAFAVEGPIRLAHTESTVLAGIAGTRVVMLTVRTRVTGRTGT